MKYLIGAILAFAVMNAPALRAEYDNWRCAQDKLACLVNEPAVFFGAAEYDWAWTAERD